MIFLKFTDVTETVDETVEEEECKTIEEEICSQPTPQFGEKCQDVQVSKSQIELLVDIESFWTEVYAGQSPNGAMN